MFETLKSRAMRMICDFAKYSLRRNLKKYFKKKTMKRKFLKEVLFRFI